jgi:hypothetical protein
MASAVMLIEINLEGFKNYLTGLLLDRKPLDLFAGFYIQQTGCHHGISGF